jgi:hypothetical protein
VGDEEAADASRVVAVDGDGLEDALGTAGRTANPGVDQGQLVAAVEQVDVAVEWRGHVEPEDTAADEGNVGRQLHGETSLAGATIRSPVELPAS